MGTVGQGVPGGAAASHRSVNALNETQKVKVMDTPINGKVHYSSRSTG